MNYEKMKLADLKILADLHEIPTNLTKDQLIKNLKLADEEKYIKPTTCEKFGKDEYLVGVDIKNHQKLISCGRFIENKEMKKSMMYSSDRIYFISTFRMM
jgi:hypothetical protein